MAVSGNERTDALLADKDWKVRRKAVLDVGYRRDAERYGNLVEALDDPDVAVRQAAILSLGRLVRPGVVDELTKPKILLADDARIRSAAISTLGEIGGIRILDAVSQCLSDPEWTVRAEATVVVSRLIDQVCEVRIPETARVLGCFRSTIRTFGSERSRHWARSAKSP
jgi:HEAT repeat protein